MCQFCFCAIVAHNQPYYSLNFPPSFARCHPQQKKAQPDFPGCWEIVRLRLPRRTVVAAVIDTRYDSRGHKVLLVVAGTGDLSLPKPNRQSYVFAVSTPIECVVSSPLATGKAPQSRCWSKPAYLALLFAVYSLTGNLLLLIWKVLKTF